MISTRDIIFDKSQIFDECMKDLLASLLKNLNALVQNIKLPDSQITNEVILDKDNVLTSTSQLDSEADVKENNKEMALFNKKKDYKLSRALEETLLISIAKKLDDDIKAKSEEECFENFQLQIISNFFMRVFLANQRFKKIVGKKTHLYKRDLSSSSSNLAELERYSLQENFLQA